MNSQTFLSMIIILWCGIHINKSSATAHIHYQGNDLPNNSYIDLSELTDKELEETVIDCIPGFPGCCLFDDDEDDEDDEDDDDDSEGARGMWVDPTGTEISSVQRNNDIYARYGQGTISLRIQDDDDIVSGIYSCVVYNGVSYNETASVGLYLNRQGRNEFIKV